MWPLAVASVGDSDAFKLVRASGLNDPGDRSKAQTALAETINGLLKAEVIYRFGPWKSADAVEWEPLKWVDWVNHRRLLEPIHCRQAMPASPRGKHPTSAG